MVRAEVLGAIERRRRWRYEDNVRIVEESFAAAGVTVTEVARRNGVAASVVFTWRRQAKLGELVGSLAPLLLPVELAPVVTDVMSTPVSDVAVAEPGRRSRRSGRVPDGGVASRGQRDAGFGRAGQAATAGRLTMGSSLIGAMLSSVM